MIAITTTTEHNNINNFKYLSITITTVINTLLGKPLTLSLQQNRQRKKAMKEAFRTEELLAQQGVGSRTTVIKI
jgi:hypothetical protein